MILARSSDGDIVWGVGALHFCSQGQQRRCKRAGRTHIWSRQTTVGQGDVATVLPYAAWLLHCRMWLGVLIVSVVPEWLEVGDSV